MKLCFCNILYSKKNDRGGLGSHIQDLSLELARSGHEVTIVTSGEKKEYFEGSVKVVQLAKVPRFSSARQLLDPFYWYQRLYYMWKLRQYVRRTHFDLVEAAEGGAEQLFLIPLRPCPVITKLHGNFRHIYNRRFPTDVVSFFERLVVSKSDGVYTSSLAYAKTIASEYKIPVQTVRIIPYGIRVNELCNPAIQEQNPAGQSTEAKESKRVLLSVGTSPFRKGALLFLEAASKLVDQNIQFILVSSEDSFKLSGQIPDNLMNLGHLERKRFYSVLATADIVVFPSQFESFGIAAYEAMLLGKPVILSKNVPLEGSAKLYERCVVLETLTASSLATAIQDIFNGKITFPPLAPGTLERMRDEYDIRSVAESTLVYYREILSYWGTGVRAVAEKSPA